MLRHLALFALSALALGAAAPRETLSWAFPGLGKANHEPEEGAPVARPGSERRFAPADLHDMSRAPDWFPSSHPPAPQAVLVGAGGAYACGYCHLPNGAGRPENARLQGLPADYIEDQVRAFANGERQAAVPDYAPTKYMTEVSRAISPQDLHAAAAYFASLEPGSTTRVVEAATIPHAVTRGFTHQFDRSTQEALGERIVEGPEDFAAFEARDPRTRYIAFVPLGAIARGGRIAFRGVGGSPSCVSCHGANLAGMGGGSPTYVVRQLAGFRSGARHDPEAGPMRAVAARLTNAQIVDVAAYAASRRPWTLAELNAKVGEPDQGGGKSH